MKKTDVMISNIIYITHTWFNFIAFIYEYNKSFIYFYLFIFTIYARI